MRKSLLVAALLFVACGPHGPINWPGTVDCAPGVSDLVGVVSRILIADGPQDQSTISDRGKRELEDLARDQGPNTIACVIERVVHDWRAPGAAREPLRIAAAARGEDFLHEVGTAAHLAPAAE